MVSIFVFGHICMALHKPKCSWIPFIFHSLNGDDCLYFLYGCVQIVVYHRIFIVSDIIKLGVRKFESAAYGGSTVCSSVYNPSF